MYSVYILQSEKDIKRYVGCTNNLKKRLRKHTNGNVAATKTRRPLELIYAEICLNKYDAYNRERYFKTGYGRRFINNRLKNYLGRARNA